MFCEIHGCLVDFRGCPQCSFENSASFQSENDCEECDSSEFVDMGDGTYSCKKCKTKHEQVPNQDGYVRRAYTSVYELFKRNGYYPEFWAKQKSTGQIIFVIDVHEKESGISRWQLSDGVFVAKYNHDGKESPIVRRGREGKSYRPYIGLYRDRGVDRSPLPKHFGFMLGDYYDDDWIEIEEPFSPPIITSTHLEHIDNAFDTFHSKGLDMATENQKSYLLSKRLNYEGDVEKLTINQARKIITKLTGKR